MFYVYRYFAFMYVSAPQAWLVPAEAKVGIGLDIELILSYHVDARSQALVF